MISLCLRSPVCTGAPEKIKTPQQITREVDFSEPRFLQCTQFAHCLLIWHKMIRKVIPLFVCDRGWRLCPFKPVVKKKIVKELRLKKWFVRKWSLWFFVSTLYFGQRVFVYIGGRVLNHPYTFDQRFEEGCALLLSLPDSTHPFKNSGGTDSLPSILNKWGVTSLSPPCLRG